MSTKAPWPGANGSSEQPIRQDSFSHHQEVLDRQMIQHLLNRYGHNGLSKLIRDEVGPQSDRSSIISSTAQSSVLSDDASSVWDIQSARTSASDASSFTGSIISNVSRSAKPLARRSASSAIRSPPSITTATDTQAHTPTDGQRDETSSSPHVVAQGNSASDDSNAAPGHSASTKQKRIFTCGFCREEDIKKTCTRKNDLKRHMEDFHNTNAQWHCKHSGCGMVFDWPAAYKTHLKMAHGGSRMSLEDSKVSLCPQVVFACGFEKCTQVYEAMGDGDATAVFKKYVAHVVKHFDNSSVTGAEWSYSTRMRNLLCQSQVVGAWNEVLTRSGGASSNLHPDDHLLRWHPQTSVVLRKRLESRHVGDVHLLVEYAMVLGSEPSVPCQFRHDFVTPVADTCQHDMPGHRTTVAARSNRVTGMVVAPGDEPSDPFSFHMSRGMNPALAQYMASRRKVYVPGRQRAVRPLKLHRVRPPLNPLAPYRQKHPLLPPDHHPQQQLTRSGCGYVFGSPAGVSQEHQTSLYYHHYPHGRPNPHHTAGTDGGHVCRDGLIVDI